MKMETAVISDQSEIRTCQAKLVPTKANHPARPTICCSREAENYKYAYLGLLKPHLTSPPFRYTLERNVPNTQSLQSTWTGVAQPVDQAFLSPNHQAVRYPLRRRHPPPTSGCEDTLNKTARLVLIREECRAQQKGLPQTRVKAFRVSF